MLRWTRLQSRSRLAETIQLHDEYTPINRIWKCFFRQAMSVPNHGISPALHAGPALEKLWSCASIQLRTSATPVLVAPSRSGIFGVNNSDGTRNSPSNPARPGDFITLYGTGGGPTNPPAITGTLWTLTTPLPSLTLNVSVAIGAR
jgi:hypothetical protein